MAGQARSTVSTNANRQQRFLIELFEGGYGDYTPYQKFNDWFAHTGLGVPIATTYEYTGQVYFLNGLASLPTPASTATQGIAGGLAMTVPPGPGRWSTTAVPNAGELHALWSGFSNTLYVAALLQQYGTGWGTPHNITVYSISIIIPAFGGLRPHLYTFVAPGTLPPPARK